MSEWFPSREWLKTYQAALNDNDTYREASEGWGVDFAGDFVFEITDVPVETTIGDLPDDLSDGLRENLESLSEEETEALLTDAPAPLDDRMAEHEEEDTDRERFIEVLLATPVGDAPQVTFPALREEFPTDLDNLLGQLERYVHDGTIYAYVDLYDGECRDTEVLEDPSACNPGFGLVGQYPHWRDLLEGADVMESIFSESLALDGSTTTILPYADAAEELGDTAGRVDSRFVF